MHLALGILLIDALLTGSVLGSSPSVDYGTGQSTTTNNLPSAAFDGDLQTFYASYDRSYTYVGLDLGTPHIITRVGWSPRNDGVGPTRTCLAVFEGSNRPDFMDALPLYITDENGTIGSMSYADVSCSRGFRYVRYVGPADGRCNVAEVEFYGHPGAGNDADLYRPTNLPCLSIHIEGNAHPQDKVNELFCYATLIDESSPLLFDSATIRLRGNASMQFPKKPYRLKFMSKHKVLGSPSKAKKWCLINNYGDKTLMRNLIAYDYSRRFGMEYVPFSRPVDVIINGEYKGCYQLADQLEVRKGRVDIEEMTPRDNAGMALTGGYFIEIDGYANEEPENIRFYSNTYGIGVTIKSPDQDSILPVQKSYIQSCFNLLETRVSGSSFTDPVSGWRSLLDEESWIQHFLVGELTGNTDTYWSCHMFKRRGDVKFYTGPEWDFDIAFDNDYRHYPTCNKSDYVYKAAGTHATFVRRTLEQDAGTAASILHIWSDARLNHGLNADTICDEIDSLAAYLEASQRLNFLRWPILSQNVHMNPRNAGSYSGEVIFLKNYVRQRFNWMDNKIGLDTTVIQSATTLSDAEHPVRIYNLQGWLVAEGNLPDHLPAGYYILQNNKHSHIIWKEE